ncbi:gamma-D-glutamyl-L-lysine endopeptidase [Lentibacillus kapialis]|uniref:Gamma-D-glutamyl-L-lysine endopeptidase n=1 Tax=Lentibacillus kapialis TaxID=340214 RepID=A0A917PTZ4_9BACI|nr:C40 family peptidase [Lentibacillus kapialis]GGJ91759.1 gamma-D-glutamyl-L-lysine endopeptidase [Lentibacillus kapialis]
MTKQTFNQFSEEIWVTSVQVATVWTSPLSPRSIDQHGISNPTNMDSWISSLSYASTVALSDENRIQTQTLYGETVIVTGIEDDWAHVVIPTQPSVKDERGYPGWIPLNQLKKMNKPDWQRENSAVVTQQHAWLEAEDGKSTMKLSYMTILPVEAKTGTRVKVNTPHGYFYLQDNDVTIFRADQGLPKRPGTELVKAGMPYIGLDYFWGGMSSFGYDCSGFAYAMHKANGYEVPRDAGDQAQYGQKIPYDRLEPGDLLFFAYEEGKGQLHHVGFYYGNGNMLHSPQTGRGIELIDLNGTIYEKELCAATRYWQQAEESS